MHKQRLIFHLELALKPDGKFSIPDLLKIELLEWLGVRLVAQIPLKDGDPSVEDILNLFGSRKAAAKS